MLQRPRSPTVHGWSELVRSWSNSGRVGKTKQQRRGTDFVSDGQSEDLEAEIPRGAVPFLVIKNHSRGHDLQHICDVRWCGSPRNDGCCEPIRSPRTHRTGRTANPQ